MKKEHLAFIRKLRTRTIHIVRIVFLLFDVLLLLLFAAGYVALYVHPRYVWWLQVMAIGLTYLSIGVLVTTVVVALASWWRWLVFHLVFCLLVLVRFAPFSGLSRSVEGEGQSLTVMTFNAPFKYWEDIPNPPYNSDVIKHAMEPLIQQEQPHMISFQGVVLRFKTESPQPTGHPHVLNLFDLGYTSFRSETPQEKAFFQPVLSKIQLDEHEHITVGDSVQDSSPISFTRALFRWQGQEVALYNVHLRSFHDNGGRPWDGGWSRLLDPRPWFKWLLASRQDFLVRASEAEQIGQMLQQETHPFIVCGDFNSTPHNWAYREISRGLTDAFKQSGKGWGASYHSRLPLIRIDHILVSPEWQVETTHIAQAEFSDHLPLVAWLFLKNR